MFNIYINDLFFIIDEVNVCNFADDTTIYACDQELDNLLNRLEHDSLLAIEWFECNYMKLNSEKSHFLLSGVKHQHHCISLGESKIWESKCEKLLGINIDQGLRFKIHISEICKKVGRKLSALGRISRFIPFHKKIILLKSFIESQFNYCPLVWMFHGRKLNNKINRLHERALRIVYTNDKSSFEELLKTDNSVSIHHRNLQFLAVELYKSFHNLSPPIIKELFTKNSHVGSMVLRNMNVFKIPKINTVQSGNNSLRYFGPQIWNISK